VVKIATFANPETVTTDLKTTQMPISRTKTEITNNLSTKQHKSKI
jgi:hypothetical protein